MSAVGWRLVTKAQNAQLRINAERQAGQGLYDLWPVVRLVGDAGTVLLTELAADADTATGLIHLLGQRPKLGTVSLAELRDTSLVPVVVRTPRGYRIEPRLERDPYWRATAPLSCYAKAAKQTGTISVATPQNDDLEVA